MAILRDTRKIHWPRRQDIAIFSRFIYRVDSISPTASCFMPRLSPGLCSYIYILLSFIARRSQKQSSIFTWLFYISQCIVLWDIISPAILSPRISSLRILYYFDHYFWYWSVLLPIYIFHFDGFDWLIYVAWRFFIFAWWCGGGFQVLVIRWRVVSSLARHHMALILIDIPLCYVSGAWRLRNTYGFILLLFAISQKDIIYFLSSFSD